MYITDPAAPTTINKTLTVPSPKSRKITAQVNYLREKVETWEQQAECIK